MKRKTDIRALSSAELQKASKISAVNIILI